MIEQILLIFINNSLKITSLNYKKNANSLLVDVKRFNVKEQIYFFFYRSLHVDFSPASEMQKKFLNFRTKLEYNFQKQLGRN